MKNNKLILLAMGIFLAVIFCLCVFMLIMPRGNIFMVEGNTALRHTTNLKIDVGTALDLTAYSENVYFMDNDGDELIIKEYYRSPRKKADIYQSDKNVMISSKQQLNFTIFSYTGGDRIEIYVPKGYLGDLKTNVSSGNIKSEIDFSGAKITCETKSGNINMKRLSANQIYLKASSGNINVTDLKGEITAKANSGNITIDRLEGMAEADASSGNIKIIELYGSVIAKVNSGNIRIGIRELGGNISATTSSGNINLDLPSESAFMFSADTSSGSIKTDFDSSLSFNSRGNSANGTIGNNAVHSVTTRASSGIIKVNY